MNITLKTRVDGHFLEVFNQFDRNLFDALKPKGAKIEIVEFTGSEVGDRVHVRFISPVRVDWISKIVERKVKEHEAFFVDESTHLPPGMSSWKHKHVVRKIDEHSCEIIDDMTFEGKNPFWSAILYPGILAGFLPRKAQYRKYFKK